MRRIIFASSILVSMSLAMPGSRNSATAAASTVTTKSCAASAFRGVAPMQGAMGHRAGGAVLTNISGHACTVRGFASIQLVDARGRTMPVHITRANALMENERGLTAQARAQGLVAVRGRAFVAFSWGNWCGFVPKLPITAVLRLPSSPGRVLVSLRTMAPNGGPSNAPPCLGKALPSSLEERAIQPVGPRVQVPA